MATVDQTDNLIDYVEDDVQSIDYDLKALEDSKDSKKGFYTDIYSAGFRDFLLKPELLRSIIDCGFEHPSEGKVAKHSTFS